MKVLFVASECAPFVKTGGLADVVGAVPKALHPLGVDVKIILPAYPALVDRVASGEIVQQFDDLFGGPARLISIRADDLDLLLLDAPHLYDRPGSIYLNEAGQDWEDNHLRFGALCIAATQVALDGVNGWKPALVHAHDWQAGLVPLLIKIADRANAPTSVITIHNIAFQGLFPWTTRDLFGIPDHLFTHEGAEYYGHLGFLKSGLAFADKITTVSPTYARELLTPTFGIGLNGLLQARQHDLCGILNGIDLDIWNPQTDPALPANYSARNRVNKRKSRDALAARFGLEINPTSPLFCVISRLTEQKGLDLLLEVLPGLVDRGGQLALLGSGSPELERGFELAAKTNPGKIGVVIGYDEELSHLIQAGSDTILVPSRFEPCGLTQLYGLRYGTLPVVAKTGGLADTVVDASKENLRAKTATGAQFSPINAEQLRKAIDQTCNLFAKPRIWRQMVGTAMRTPVGWEDSAPKYLELYRETAAKYKIDGKPGSMKVRLRSGNHHHMGARFDGNGTNFAVFSANATGINLCLFSPDGKTEIDRLPLPERTGNIWHGYAPGIRPGDLYGYRAEGIYAPDQGHRFNANKLLMDPYTRELSGTWFNNSATLGYVKSAVTQDLSFDNRDSAQFVPKSVVSDPELFSHIESHAGTDWSQTLIYEAHAKGQTMEHLGIADHVRGTYEALASEPMLEHLQKLGVNAVELLPVHAFIDDGFLLKKQLRNYWGYNTIGFFAPEPRYFGPQGLAGFRNMVRRFHAAGIKVILDAVYNHTAESDHRGPTLCYRGLDNASYYWLISGQPRYYVNDTGTGNTVNVSNPHVLRLVMDSLRFWVQQMGIDGFRFDLATTLGREDHGFDPHGGFFDAIRQDPVLAETRFIAEPWDIGPGGYQLGGFPAEFSEWNDSYRDTVRRYWRGDHRSAQELGARLLGSADKFETDGRGAWTSVNFVTSHDGFTLADLTRYNESHNQPNGENGTDGHQTNLSDNFGIEGETEDRKVRKQRALRQRNMLATLFLSQGTPMLLAGDEFSNSQKGNNNAYSQDNSIGWLNWGDSDEELIEFVSRLSEFRRRHPCLRQSHFLHSTIRESDGLPDAEWSDFKGDALQWHDPGLSNLCLTLRMSDSGGETEGQDDTVFVVFNRDGYDASVRLPKIRPGHHWVRAIDTAAPDVFAVCEFDGKSMVVAGHSVVVAVSQPDAAPR